jgi:hypothetical protein
LSFKWHCINGWKERELSGFECGSEFSDREVRSRKRTFNNMQSIRLGISSLELTCYLETSKVRPA